MKKTQLTRLARLTIAMLILTALVFAPSNAPGRTAQASERAATSGKNIIVQANSPSGYCYRVEGGLCQTIALAMGVAAANDTIAILGNISESVVVAKNLNFISLTPSTPSTISGKKLGPVFTINQGVHAKFTSLIITGGSGSQGGGIKLIGGLTSDNKRATVDLYDVTITDNNVTGDGGGIYVGEHATLTLDKDSVVNANVASATAGHGGGIHVASGALVVIYGDIHHNSARWGGGIQAVSGQVILYANGKVRDNTASLNGAGISLEGTASNTSFLTINDGSEIKSNIAEDSGGGVYAPRFSRVKMYGSVTNNQAKVSGGGVYIGSSSLLEMWNSTGEPLMQDNVAQDGGGIYNGGGTVNVTDGIVSRNTARDDGGGIYNNAGTVIIDLASTVTNNVAKHGGGIYNDGQNAKVTVKGGSAVDKNLAYGNVSLAGYWPFEGNSLRDVSGNGHTAYPNSGGYYAGGAPAQLQGRSGIVFGFRGAGANEYFTAPLNVSETAYAMSLWFKTACTDCGIFQVDNGNLNVSMDRTVYLENGNLCARTVGGGTVCSTGVNYADDGWHHVVHTYGAAISGHKIYVDGKERGGNTSTSSTWRGDIRITLGYARDATTKYLTGQVDDVRIYNQALTADQVATLSTGADLGGGGGIYNRSGAGQVIIEGSSSVSNNAAGVGGGVYNSGLSVEVTNSQISDNAAEEGGGVYNVNSSSVHLNSGSFISRNRARKDGGGVYNSGEANLRGTVSDNEASRFGGGIYDYFGTTNVINGTISGNDARASGGGLYNFGGKSSFSDGSTVSGNSATHSGGGIFSSASGSVTTIDSAITDNTASADGGGIFNDGGVVTLGEGSKVSRNTAADHGGGIFSAGQADGGGIEIASSTAQNGIAALSTDGTSNVTVFGSVMNDNQAGVSGGGIYIDGDTVALTDSKVSGNTATTGNGGGIYNDGGEVILTDSTIGGGTVEQKNTAQNGGGIYSTGDTAQVNLNTNSFVSGNTATTGNGGGIYNKYGTLTLTNSVVGGNTEAEGNTAQNGGGIYHDGTTVLAIENSTISHNISMASASNDRGGGGLYVAKGSAVLTNSTFRDNRSSNANGGAIFNLGTIRVEDSILDANSSARYGGGIYNYVSRTATLTNTTISGNTATSGGGGIYNYAGSVALSSSTVNGNKAIGSNGGGIYNSQVSSTYVARMSLTNSTVSGNSATTNGGGIYNHYGTLNADFVTLYANKARAGLNLAMAGSHQTTLYATIVAQGTGQNGANCVGWVSAASDFNRVSDTGCGMPSGKNNEVGAHIDLDVNLAYNGGPTLNHLPTPNRGNAAWEGGKLAILDQIPPAACTVDVDQRGRGRPRRWSTDFLDSQGERCDVGAVEYYQVTRYVCSDPTNTAFGSGRKSYICDFDSIQTALDEAVDDDTIVIAGLIEENVVVTKSLTIRGPSVDEATPGTHMGIVQAETTAATTFIIGSTTSCPSKAVTIQNLNIGGGSGGVRNYCNLNLDGVTVYNNTTTGVDNRGALTLINSTLSSNAGNAVSNQIGASLTITHSTLFRPIVNNGRATVQGSILAGCSGTNPTGAGNLNFSTGCAGIATVTTAAALKLGPLRDNGGPTFTRAIRDVTSPAVGVEGSALDGCASLTADQRGKARPLNRNGQPGGACDIGAVEFGSQTLTACAACNPDPANLLYKDLQEALDHAMAGDTIAVRAGVYTGNFIAYKDGTIRHAGLTPEDINRLDPAEGTDVRAILQASPDPIFTQAETLTPTRGSDLAGSVLTVQGYAATSLQPNSDVAVTLQELTIRQGMALQGGGIFNRGVLTLTRTTVHDNVSLNRTEGNGTTGSGQGGAIYNSGSLYLQRSTLSGNRSEFQGGAIYNAVAPGVLDIKSSSLVDNVAAPLPAIYAIGISDSAFDVSTVPASTIRSGDWLLFESRGGSQARTIAVTPGAICNRASVPVPLSGAGKSAPLICTSATNAEVTLKDGNGHETKIQIVPQVFAPEAHTVYNAGSTTTIGHSLLFTALGVGPNCNSALGSGGYNRTTEDSCKLGNNSDRPSLAGVDQATIVGPLQDNNQIDFASQSVSGYVYTHALPPGSPAVDQILVKDCFDPSVAVAEPIVNPVSINVDMPPIQAGDILRWQTSTPGDFSVALDDGNADVRLIRVKGGDAPIPTQLFESVAYRVYDSTGAEKGSGRITVTPRVLPTDQRGVSLPLRGVRPNESQERSYYNCDVGAVEFQPWVVGQAVPRPPSAVGQNASWTLNNGSNGDSYHLWSLGSYEELVLRPSLDAKPDDTTLPDTITVTWKMDARPGATGELSQVGLSIWPDDPQLHIAGATVNFAHDQLVGDFRISPEAETFKGLVPQAQNPLTGSVFTRTLKTDGETYSVLNFVDTTNGSQPAAQVQVVRTVGWQTPGLEDTRPLSCTIGTELDYSFTGADGQTVRHQDPEGRPGHILAGDAFDGVETAGETIVVQNTVDGLIPPAHIRQDRQGPILPVLERVPNPQPIGGTGNDLEVAWYRPDARNVAWPVKAAGYVCHWPNDPDQIVIASELGSEIGGQEILDPTVYGDPTVYHQPISGTIGYSPNWEHALLASSNLGNPAPALYALRTDLAGRLSGGENDAYALLKYRDLQDEGRVQMKVYQVKLTQDPEALSPAPTIQAGNGSVTVPGGQVTVPVMVSTNGQALHTITAQVTFEPDQVTPVGCTPNRNDFVEAPAGLKVSSEENVRPGWVAHFQAQVAAGTDVQYEWYFDSLNKPDEKRIAGSEVSTVYESPGPYTVRVRAFNSFGEQSATAEVIISATAVPKPLPGTNDSGCRIENDNTLVFQMQARNKHGEIGDVALADITFEKKAGGDGKASPLDAIVESALGPDYEKLRYNITAGNPVYAPTPLRGLLDVQSCEGTQVYNDPLDPDNGEPYWEDFKGQVWARSAGTMEALYFYPLQPGFALSQEYARELQLDWTGDFSTADLTGQCVPWMEKLGETATRPAKNNRVLPVEYTVSWPLLAPVLTVGETVFERPKNGISGVAEQLAVTRIYDQEAPGRWVEGTDEKKGSLAISGLEAVNALVQLIDPVGAVRVELPVTVDGNASLPAVIKSKRLLFGGGNALIANTDEPDTALPFSLRSRILFEDTPQDINGDDTANGVLVFQGYYDGASPAYIKGDPLLLLNVMSMSDKERLLALCPVGKENCDKYRDAIEKLYWKSLNPRDLDLCRTDGIFGSNGSLDQRYAPDAPTDALTGNKSNPCPDGGERDGLPDWDFLIAVQDSEEEIDPATGRLMVVGNGIPEPYEGLGKGKAVTAGNAAGTGYVTLAYNNDDSLGGLPVSLQVIQVGCTLNQDGEDSTYRGNLLTIESDNLFDEKLTLRHTGDFGGKPDGYDFEWYYAPVDDTGVSPTTQPPAYPWRKWNGAGADTPEITIEGANVTTLSDNWFVMRYKNYSACGNSMRYSAYAGDPSAKPSELRAQLAQGWIKRVTNALNPFDARVDDFVSSPVNSTVDMIAQAGPRYEGPVALSNDPDTLNKMGLIEAYQTVLERGRTLSIDSNINDQGANAALLNVTTRIADLYMLLANDAYMDALDPTVALGMESEFGSRAPSLFAFMNQFNAAQFGLIDEELALLRGRDETLGGVAAGPTYNRLTWNFTNGTGEVAYVQNYNMKDWNQDGFVNEADAFIRYPQGHGDAWGHYLTALTQYYQLLRHPNYTWSPRAEPISVAGAPVVVDYYDERRFAIDAAAKAEMGVEIVDLTYRKHWADPESQAYVDDYIDLSDTCRQQKNAPEECNRRAWGVADWAVRSVQGAYFDWAVANAILPVEEGRFEDVRKIDRSTVLEIGQIADRLTAIQEQLDQADQGANPLGVTGNAVLFDLDPALVADGETHFEQVYQRTLTSLDNTVARFNYANALKLAQREGQNEERDFVTSIVDEDRAIINDLIELFGYPYDADIGVNGTYPAGYDGPDIYNYDLYDRNALTNADKRCNPGETCPISTTTFLVPYAPLQCLGKFVHRLGYDLANPTVEDICAGGKLQTSTGVTITYRIAIGLDAGRGRFKPASWPESSARKSTGEIPNMLQALTETRLEYEMAIVDYQNHVEAMQEKQIAIKDRAEVLDTEETLSNASRYITLGLETSILASKAVAQAAKNGSDEAKFFATATAECFPTSAGVATDVTSPTRCAARLAGAAAAGATSGVELATDVIMNVAGLGISIAEKALETDLFDLEQDYELRQLGREMQGMLREEKEKRLALFLAADKVGSAQGDYDQTKQRAFRRLQDLIILRQRWAGQITEQRYNDMAYRLAQFDALQQYRKQFDLTQLYVYLTAAAYDYETNLAVNDPNAADKFLRNIVGQRALGEVVQQLRPDGTVIPIPGQGGLADPLARMHDNFEILKGQMGFNNPQDEATVFSLRSENFRLRDESDTAWRQELARYYTPDIFANDDVARLAKRPFGEDGAVPGLVIPFGSTITSRLNFFGQPLGPGDMSFDASQFATKIAAVGVLFDGYDTERLAGAPRVYLLPAGQDVMRPRGSEGVLRYWNVSEQLLPLPYTLGQTELQNPNWIPRFDGLSGQLFQTKTYPQLRAYAYDEEFAGDPLTTDTRLIGRSVWNTQWLLVIPGPSLLADPYVGIDRFVEDVEDIHLYFQTYAYAGTARSADAPKEPDAFRAPLAGELAASPGSRTATRLDATHLAPRPDAIAYGPVRLNGVPKSQGTVKALLPDGSVVTVPIREISGTDYSFVLEIPVGSGGMSLADQGIQFFVDDLPAYFQDQNGLPSALFSPVPGQPALLDLRLGGSSSYMLGDVNANGRRDSADAMLTLKYDVGLIVGVEQFPPAPNTIYVPLCDIQVDGLCNSGDALRILRCDAGLNPESCPASPVRSVAAAALQPTVSAELRLSTQITQGVQTDTSREPVTITVRILAQDSVGSLGAAGLELHYPAELWQLVACTTDPALSMGVCNPDYAPGRVRFSATRSLATGETLAGSQEIALAEIRFQRLPAAATDGADLASLVSLHALGIFDQQGEELAWGYATTSPSAPERSYQIYLSLLNRSSQADPSADTGSTEVPDAPAVGAAPEPLQGYWLYLPVLNDPSPAEGLPDTGNADTPDSSQPPQGGESSDQSSPDTGAVYTIYTPFVSVKE